MVSYRNAINTIIAYLWTIQKYIHMAVILAIILFWILKQTSTTNKKKLQKAHKNCLIRV